jgi:hypothetical protein
MSSSSGPQAVSRSLPRPALIVPHSSLIAFREPDHPVTPRLDIARECGKCPKSPHQLPLASVLISQTS